jgi:hypothetical protein
VDYGLYSLIPMEDLVEKYDETGSVTWRRRFPHRAVTAIGRNASGALLVALRDGPTLLSYRIPSD